MLEVLYIVTTRGCASIAFGGDYTLSACLSCAACDSDFKCVGGSLWCRICVFCITCSVQCSGDIMKEVSFCVHYGVGTVLVTLSCYPNW